MVYREAIQYLYDLRWYGAKLGLENIRALAALAGQPHTRLRFIHVAGTNGKGSTCAMLESVYRAAGLRVGLFTSPHLVHFSERIQVNRQPIPEAEVVRLVRRLVPWVKTFPEASHPTFFEAVTLMALLYFEEQQCDLVVWETGLGGRLDATNLVTPLASVITNIQLDHQKWLGHTLAQIAREKAGIIKPGVPVLTATDAPEALAVIREVAGQLRAPLTVVTAEETTRPPLGAIELPLLGDHQRLNAALAVAVVRQLAPRLPVPEIALRRGLQGVHWPGRLQLVRRPSGQKVLLDGAHNPAGAAALRAAFLKHFAGAPAALILGMLEDKDREAMCRILAPLAQRIWAAPVDSERTASAPSVAALCQRHHPQAQVTACGSLVEALAAAQSCPFVIVTGSLHFLGEAMELLAVAPVPAFAERPLNDWHAPAPRPTEKARG